MRLRLIEKVDFRKNELTNYKEVCKKRQMRLGRNDVICFYSLTGNQVTFVFRPQKIKFEDYNLRPGEATISHSTRLRLSDRSWDPLMLQDYADRVNLQLDGIRRLKDFMKVVRQERSAEMAEKRAHPEKKKPTKAKLTLVA